MTDKITPPSNPATIQRLTNAVYAPLAMKAGMQLDVFTPLKGGPMTAEALAGAVGVEIDRFALLLYALVAAELLVVDDGRFANTPEADRLLVRGRPGFMGNTHYLFSELWGGAMHTGDSIRDGAPRSKHDFANMDEAELSGFYRGTHPGTLAAGRQLAEMIDFSAVRRLIDIGSGSGGVSISLCEANPGLHATVADLASVGPIARRIIDQAGMAERIDVMTLDILAGPPDGAFDTAVLRNLIQVLSKDDARRALGHIGEAMASGGAIHVWGWLLDDDRLAPMEAVVHNLVFINFYDDGQSHIEGDLRDWLGTAGFGDVVRRKLDGGLSLVSARKT